MPKGDELSFSEVEAQLDQTRLPEEQLVALKRELVGSTSPPLVLRNDNNSPIFKTLGTHEKSIAFPLSFVVEMVQMVELIPIAQSIPGIFGVFNEGGERL